MAEPRECIECHEIRKIHARGRCMRCVARVRRLDPEMAAKSREASRAWKRNNKRQCVDCGAPTTVASGLEKAAERCRRCNSDRLSRQYAEATERVLNEAIALRAEGLTNVEIAEHMNYSTQHIANLFHKAKRAGVDVPRSPWFKRAA